MTWKEFKEQVEKEMERKRMSENIPIFFIHIGNDPDQICVFRQDKALAISN